MMSSTAKCKFSAQDNKAAHN